MNRRGFLSALIAVPIAAIAAPKQFVWDKTRVDFVANWQPHPAQIEFLNRTEDSLFFGNQYYVTNPRSCAVISNIAIPDGY